MNNLQTIEGYELTIRDTYQGKTVMLPPTHGVPINSTDNKFLVYNQPRPEGEGQSLTLKWGQQQFDFGRFNDMDMKAIKTEPKSTIYRFDYWVCIIA
jgi:hypothetical protein